MIHQFIFAGPKPGLAPEAFCSYWVHFHAVEFAAKIRQIRQYLVATKLGAATGRDLPFFEGVAEVWLDNDEEEIASLQSPEFLQGARADEPRWAAFWQTFGIDTNANVLQQYATANPLPNFVKLYLLIKRNPTLLLHQFQQQLLTERQAWLGRLVGSTGHLVGFARPNLYGVGEPRFDAVETISFESRAALEQNLSAKWLRDELRAGWSFADTRYIFAFAAQEHWIIRPGDRLGTNR